MSFVGISQRPLPLTMLCMMKRWSNEGNLEVSYYNNNPDDNLSSSDQLLLLGHPFLKESRVKTQCDKGSSKNSNNSNNTNNNAFEGSYLQRAKETMKSMIILLVIVVIWLKHDCCMFLCTSYLFSELKHVFRNSFGSIEGVGFAAWKHETLDAGLKCKIINREQTNRMARFSHS